MGPSMPSDSLKTEPTRIIQMTDCHLGSAPNATLLGLNTDQSLHDVLELIQAEQQNIAACICTGDISIDGKENSYRRFLSITREYLSCPLAWLPGNHDSSAVMARLEHPNKPANRTLSVNGWLIILLDSSVPNQTHGELAASEIAFLSETLDANPTSPTLVMLHHQPVPMGSHWIDQHIIDSRKAFWAAIKEHTQVKCVSWGHVHQAFEQHNGAQLLLATPSTCVQFKPQCEEFTIDTSMPGYRWLDLYPDGQIKTGISRVTPRDYHIDFLSLGY